MYRLIRRYCIYLGHNVSFNALITTAKISDSFLCQISLCNYHFYRMIFVCRCAMLPRQVKKALMIENTTYEVLIMAEQIKTLHFPEL